jgi:hypothetical protein
MPLNKAAGEETFVNDQASVGLRGRETMELLRDPIRLGFALLGPLILMIAFGYGVSLENAGAQMLDWQ